MSKAHYSREEIDRVKSILLKDIRNVLSHLFPNGKFVKNEFHIGYIYGNAGQSLKVCLSGDKAGLWQDFATGDGGDIFSLWAYAKGIDIKPQFKELIEDILKYTGNIYHFDKNQNLGRQTGKWTYTDNQGKPLSFVVRYDQQGKKKEFRTYDERKKIWKFPEIRPLYNQVGISKSEKVILVEGEKCAEALIQSGVCATTAMGGCKAPLEKTDFSPLRNKAVVIWPDHDAGGYKHALRLVNCILAAGACSVLMLEPPSSAPEKWDAADAVKEGFDIKSFLETAKPVAVEEAAQQPPQTTAIPSGLNLWDWTAERYKGTAPSRGYLIDECISMGNATLLVAMGDTGKGILCLDLALKVAGVRYGDDTPLCLGKAVMSRGTAVILMAEDDEAEVHRRLQVLDPEEKRLENPKHLIAVPLPNAGGPISLVQMKGKSFEPTEEYYALSDKLLAIKDLKVLVIDPISCFFHVDINADPVAANYSMGLMAELASKTGASVIMTHHMRKQTSGSGKISTPEDARDAIRGTSALVDGVRTVYALWPAEEREAKTICRNADIEYQSRKVFQGAVVKSNFPADKGVRMYVRDDTSGLLNEIKINKTSNHKNEKLLMDSLVESIDKKASRS